MRTNKNLIAIGLLLIAIFSLSTVFGLPVGGSHPKKHIDNVPYATVYHHVDTVDLTAFTPVIVTSYLSLFDDAITDILEHLHQSLSVTLKNQKSVLLSALINFKQRLLYIFHKTISAVRSIHYALSYYL
ncbi:hypothetical protein ACMAZF_12010 [Psychrobium sp. nBUS_13]|uniref:hypothetical protein n=1 Tax=Psychrobium sp. nBUS_13 TaxID=3395319 RepID=UPI003EC0FBFC